MTVREFGRSRKPAAHLLERTLKVGDSARLRVSVEWLLVPVLLIGLWQTVSWKVGPVFLPDPQAAFKKLAEGLWQRWLIEELVVTATELAWGFAWAAGIGLVIGFLLGSRPLLRAAYQSPLLALYSVPKVTLFPVFLFMFKLGIESKIAFGAFHGLFPVAIYTWSAMTTIRPVYFKVAAAMRLSAFAIFRTVVLPAGTPAVVTGLRAGLNLTFLGVILGEMFASRAGLGFLLMSFSAAFDMAQIVAVILVIFTIALGLNVPLLALEHRMSRWADSDVK